MPENEPKKGGMALMIAMGKPKSDNPKEDIVEEASREGESPTEEMAEKQIYDIPIPQGYEPPTEDGKDWDEVVKFRRGDDGSLRIVKIGSVATDDADLVGDDEGMEAADGTGGGNDVPMETESVEPDANKALGMAMQRQRGM